ncbi:MAG: glycosyltransferase family 9 protein [Deltaproteobacteria bacterium]|nr:glycosyltransferase family 9 protein [Deltaproteobacteria bacterium]
MTSIGANIHLPPRPRILIILMGSLGDVTRGLCVVSQIKRVFADASITWLVEDKWAELVRLHPQIDRVLIFERNSKVVGTFRLQRELRAARFDISFDMQRILKSGICAWLTGAKWRVGFHPKDSKEGNHFFNNCYIEYQGEHSSKTLHYLKFVEKLGIEVSFPLDFGIRGIDLRVLAPHLAEKLTGRYVVLVLGSSWQSKNWTEAGYRGLLEKLLGHGGYGVVLVGASSQAVLARELAAGSGILNLVGETSLTELVGVLKGASAAIGPDSGPGHVAAALGVPYLALIGPTAAVRVAPYGSEELVVESHQLCAPCYQRRCPGMQERCMREIRAEMVWEKLQVIINEESQHA